MKSALRFAAALLLSTGFAAPAFYTEYPLPAPDSRLIGENQLTIVPDDKQPLEAIRVAVAGKSRAKNGATRAPFLIPELLLTVRVSLVVQTLVSTSCVIFSNLHVRTDCVRVVAQLVNFRVQSLNV
ncbi:L,D-transpeptidase|nr:L,D-transpeptidase [Candidatus Pantoea persica]